MIFEIGDTLVFIGDSISDYDRKRPIQHLQRALDLLRILLLQTEYSADNDTTFILQTAVAIGKVHLAAA